MNDTQRKELVALIDGYLSRTLTSSYDAALRIVDMVSQVLAPEPPALDFPLLLHDGGNINLFQSLAHNRIAICFQGLDMDDTEYTQYSRLTRSEAQAIIARLTDLVNKLPEDAHEA